MAIRVTREVIEALIVAAEAAHPLEACGLLFGEHDLVERYQPTKNVHPDPVRHFEIDPEALIHAHRAERDGGQLIMGYFHSHPVGMPQPSQTDAAMAAGDGKIWAILGRDELGFWRSTPEGFHELSHQILDR